MDLIGLGALCLVSVEWLALGTLSGIDWPSTQRAPWGPRWALRVLLGAVLIAVAQLALALMGAGFGSLPLVLLVAALLAGAIRALNRGAACVANQQPTRPPDQQSMERRERAGWALLGVLLLAASARSLLVPEAGWDAFSHWGLRAQAFALARTVVDARSEHEYYPPLVPLLEAWLYLHRGAVSIDLGKTVWAVLGSAFAVCLSWHLRLSLRASWLAPIGGALIVASTTELLESFWTGQGDLALTAFLTLSTLALLQARRSANPAWQVQAAVFAAAAALTKFEGLPRLGVVVVALLLDRLLPVGNTTKSPALSRRWRRGPSGPLVVVAGACAWLLWLAFELTRGISANGEHLGQLQPLALGGMLISLLGVMAGARTGGGALVALLAWAVAGRSMFSGALRPLSLIVLGQLAATLLALLLSDTSPEIAVRTSATRLFEQFLPLALFAGAVGLQCVGRPDSERAESAIYNPY